MKVIVCVEDRGGRTFGGRRVSRDREVTADILRDLKGATLFAEEYSKPLFSDFDCTVKYSDAPLDEVGENGICFVERESLKPYAEKITAVTVYRWNRRYPWDKGMDIEPEALGLRLVSTFDIAGYSHEKITKEIFER